MDTDKSTKQPAVEDIRNAISTLRQSLEGSADMPKSKMLSFFSDLLRQAELLEGTARRLGAEQSALTEDQNRLDALIGLRAQLRINDIEAKLNEAEQKRAIAEKNALICQDSLTKRDKELATYERLKATIGEHIESNPEVIDAYIKKLLADIQGQKTITENYVKDIGDKNQEIEEWKDKVEDLKKLWKENFNLERDIEKLKRNLADKDADMQRLQARLNTYENPEGNKLTREARTKQLEALCDVDPCDRDSLIKKVRDAEGPAETADEATWVDGICGKIEEEQYKFPKRVVQAFHTMLKCAEMSPLSVLAGISGTGKSLLPMLYARHAGIHFLNVPVQPNWDSQESMLGYYNSIENCFEAEPILPLLLLSQQEGKEEKEGKDGYRDHMFMILLDEMNLAHVELYFAQFLSKLEERRVAGGVSLDIKIGPDVRPYPLSLGKNVLWVGTMNQDETTKSLSDKVLDRSNILYFPRPKELAERKLGAHSQKSPAAAKWLSLSKSWQEWCQPAEIDDTLKVRGYKKLIEGMNKFLAPVNRALGHRVWQSIDLYLRLHPNVREAAAQEEKDKTKIAESLDKAFVDQLVLKVMPKLRGIDNGSKDGKDCLNNIHTLIKDFELTEQLKDAFLDDFGKAREAGYNQFQWCSSECMQDID